MKGEIPRWNEVLRRETEARRQCEVEVAQLRQALQERNRQIQELNELRKRDAATIQQLQVSFTYIISFPICMFLVFANERH